MEVLKDKYSITELSERLDVTDHTLRYYEKEFDIEIPKDSRGRRYYTSELANLMYKIKSMRIDGFEIKAIKKILSSDYENAVFPPVVICDNDTCSITPVNQGNCNDLSVFLDDFRQKLSETICLEVSGAREKLIKELHQTKLELGACIENSSRKIERKLEKHFAEVDTALFNWRERNRKGLFRKPMR